MQEQVAGIIDKIDKMPLDAIGRHVDAVLVDLDRTLRQVDGQMLPAAVQTLQQARQTLGLAQGALGAEAPMQQNLAQTLQEMQRAARSLRGLTDLLGAHPEALLRGMPKDPPPARAAPAEPPR